MARVRFTQRAREDLLDIWAHIAGEGSPRTANEVFDFIEERCANLAVSPRIGRARPEIAEKARSLVVKRWVVFYRIDGSDVQIVRVVDGARDLEQIEWAPE